MTRMHTTLAVALAALIASPAVASAGARGPAAMLQDLDFAQIDADADGAITLPEWRAFATARAEALRADRVARLMEGDADGDGLLSPDELAARLGALAEERMERPERMERRHARAALGPEGRMGAGDPERRVVRSFQRIDADGDGRITPAEFDAAKARLAARIEARRR